MSTISAASIRVAYDQKVIIDGLETRRGKDYNYYR
jgi:hypothetical protein